MGIERSIQDPKRRHEHQRGTPNGAAQPIDPAATLIGRHSPIVRRIASTVRRQYAPWVDVDDLCQIGLLALVEAAGRWQDRGLPFTGYAATRIRGAMIDSLRAAHPGSRTTTGPKPRFESLDAMDDCGGWHFADPADPVDALLVRAQGVALLAEAVARLPEREALVLQLYFAEELSLEQIGAILDVGSARVCQIKGAALKHLRTMIDRDAVGLGD